MSNAMEAWSAAEPYEGYVGRWSRLIAPEFLAWLEVDAGHRWLDVGCGTGALSDAILRTAHPREVLGIDQAEAYVQYARATIADDRASFHVGDAQQLPPDQRGFDVAVSGLVLNFLPDPDTCVSAMSRAVNDGGTVAAYVWDYAKGMELMRHLFEAAAEVDPDARRFDEGRRFPLCQPDPLAELFSRHVSEVAVTEVVVPTHFRDFDDYWTPFLGGQGAAPKYVMSLSEGLRVRLRDLLRSRLPTAPDGSIHLRARAWAVKGVAPQRDRSGTETTPGPLVP